MPRILVVDDNDLFRDALRLTLMDIGYAVTEARNGNEAIRAYEQEPADAVMMDLIMPEKEGLETIQVLRKTHPTVKIIAMSGLGSAKDTLKIAKAMGADSVLAKPFSTNEMTVTLDHLLGKTS